MKNCKILLSKNAYSDLSKLQNKTSKRIVAKLEFFENLANPLSFAKKLKDKTLGEYRFRIGNYRILFDVSVNNEIMILNVLTVKHRKHAY